MQSPMRPSSRALVQANASDQPRSLELARPRRPSRPRLLRKSDLENKLLITRTTGRQFGKVGEAWVEPRRLQVQSFDVAVNTQMLRMELCGSVPLQSIREVGDVVLIHSDVDFKTDVLTQRLNLMTVPGLKLVLDGGRVVGRCVDFVFEPENGRIVKLVFHTVNLPFAHQKWFDQYAVGVQKISRIVLSERVIYLKEDATWNKVGVGEYQFLANLIPSFESIQDDEEEMAERMRMSLSDRTGSSLEAQYQQLLDESRRQQQAYYAQYVNDKAPATQRRSPSQMPPMRSPVTQNPKATQAPTQTPARRPRMSESNVRMDDWLVREENKEELFMQE